jgi:hypothetical protein
MKINDFLAPIVALSFLATPAVSFDALAADEIVSPLRGSDKGNCQSVHAVMGELVVVECPTGQVFDFCFTREMKDPSGVIAGKLEYFSDPSKAAKLQHAADQEQYNGTINIVTESGVIQMEENGIIDSMNRDWAGLSTISGGTGDFEGATGKLATLGNGGGGGLVIGTICKG